MKTLHTLYRPPLLFTDNEKAQLWYISTWDLDIYRVKRLSIDHLAYYNNEGQWEALYDDTILDANNDWDDEGCPEPNYGIFEES